MKCRTVCQLLLSILLISATATAQTITSTATGGVWTNGSTWQGGFVPGAANDVVINGIVIIQSNVACRNLTVNSGATLQNDVGYDISITVGGNVINNGTVTKVPSRWWLYVDVKGNVTNNGTWSPYWLYLSGSSNQVLSSSGNNAYDGLIDITDTTGQVLAGSPLMFKSGFNLHNSAFNMQSYALTLDGGGSIYNGRVVNTADVTVKNGAVMNSILLAGSTITFHQRAILSSGVSIEGNVVVADTMENQFGGDFSVAVKGSLTNNGVVRNAASNWWLYIDVMGNIANNGSWAPHLVYLSGKSDQLLSQSSGRCFDAPFQVTDTAGSVLAASGLTFKAGFDLGKSAFNAQGFALSFEGGGGFTNGRVIGAADITVKNGAMLGSITYIGSTMTLRQHVILTSGVSFEGNVVVADTLENQFGADISVSMKGNFTNNGIVRKAASNWYLYVDINGNIVNNGSWSPYLVTLSGKTNQTISQAVGKSFDGPFQVTDTTGLVVAGSALTLKAGFDLRGSRFDLANNALVLDGSGTIYSGRVLNAGNVTVQNGAMISNVTLCGSPMTFRQHVILGSGVTIEGSLIVADTMENQFGADIGTTINGSITNNGVVRKVASNWYLYLDITGDIINHGTWAPYETHIAGSGSRTINAPGMQNPVIVTGPMVTLVGDNALPDFSINSNARCLVDYGATVRLTSGGVSGKMENNGLVTTSQKIASTAANYSFFNAYLSIVAGSILDSLKIECYGAQVPASYANAVKAWWRISSKLKSNGTTTIPSVRFTYDPAQLGNNVESQLQVYLSPDSGKTWRLLSTSSNTTRDLNAKTITIPDIPVSGDILLSSSSDPVSVQPSIVTAVIGRPQVRLGAPNPFTIQIVNNSDVAAEDFLLTINTGNSVHIQRAEIPSSDGSTLVLTRDSLFYENEDTTVVFYVLKMAPREERVFTIIATASGSLPKTSSLRKTLFIDPVSLTAAAVITWAAWKAGTYVVCKGINYVGDKLSDGLKLSPADQKRYDDAVKGGIPNELEQHPSKVKVFALKTVGGMALKKTLDLAPGGSSAVKITGTVLENVKKVAPSLRQRVFNWFYKETGLYGVEETESGNTYQPQVATVTAKKGQLVRSWDPNQKVGPGGFGDKNYIATAARMTYQVLFENKKEASAPAWRVAIVDTLRPEFDPATFQFGRTSHQGSQYNWVTTRNGNIVTWVIEGIELPPNVNPPEGEGWVEFSVEPRSGLASGTSLQNSATITFDVNPPIATNSVVNILDITAPATLMKAVPQKLTSDKIVVRWQSADGTNGSGVGSTTVYQSEDGGLFTAVGTTNADSLIVSVDAGSHRYSYYALATDNVGNMECVRPAVVTIDVVNDASTVSSVPLEFRLSQNYPNPFNPSTTIRFELPKAAIVSLRIFNILGQVIATLVDGRKEAGSYQVQWTCKAPSGVYFYRLQAGEFVESKRMIVLR